MARVTLGMQGQSDLESLQRLVGLAAWLGFPSESTVTTNIQSVYVSAAEATVDWANLEESDA